MSDELDAQTTISIREVLVFYYRNRSKLVWAFLLPLILFISASFVPSPLYPASAVLIVRMGSEYIYQPESGSGMENSPMSIPFDREQVFKSEVAILASDELHRKVIQQVGVDTLYPEKHGVRSMINDVVGSTVKAVTKAFGIEQEVETPEQHTQARLDQAVAIFDKRFDILLEKESAVINVGFQHKDADVARKALQVLLNLYFEKRKELYHESRVMRVQTQADEAKTRMDKAIAAIENYKKAHDLHSLDNQREILLDARSEVEKLRSTLQSVALDDKLAYYNDQLKDLDAQERQMDIYDREVKVASDQYALYSRKLDEAKSFEQQEHDRESGVRIVQAPTTPADPKKIQILIIIAGVFVSILSMLGRAAYLEFSNSGFDTPERLERRLGLPVLAVISYNERAD